jgi:23S rRNA (guanosine2251-2'-O)-methyltransferase
MIEKVRLFLRKPGDPNPDRRKKRKTMSDHSLLVGGFHAVWSSLNTAPQKCVELWVRRGLESGAAVKLIDVARITGVSVQIVTANAIDRLYEMGNHQGVVLKRKSPSTVVLKTLLEDIVKGKETPLILVLDNIQDPQNFGACLRVADGAGVDAVVFSTNNSAQISNTVARVASGALDAITLVPVPNIAAAIKQICAANIWVTGACDDESTSLYDIDFTLGTAIVVGNEGVGLRKLTRARCDHLAAIPMRGKISSLNVASATSVFLFEALRQRH